VLLFLKNPCFWGRIIIDFLCSDQIQDVGPVKALRIVKTLGNNALERIINEGPDLLKTVQGISEKKAENIYYAILQQFEFQSIAQELLPMGITGKETLKAYQQMGSHTAEEIKENPYVLINLGLADFARADKIALDSGIKPSSPLRVEAAILFCLFRESRGGHCFLEKEKLIALALKELNNSRRIVGEDDISSSLQLTKERRTIIVDREKIYLPHYYYAELNVAQSINELCFSSSCPPKLDYFIDSYEKKAGIVLAPKQKEAIKQLFFFNMLILTGGPGTGKTETIKGLVDIYKAVYPQKPIALVAPTGRASRRLAEITGRDAQTIHRLLRIYRPGQKPEFNRNNPLPYSLLIIDEASMIDILLAEALFAAIAPHTKVLVVGDKDQLPPVGPGHFLKDLLDAGVPAVYLTEIFRQAAESQIVHNAHLINQGKMIDVNSSKNDFYYLRQTNPEKIIKLTKQAVARLLEKGYSMDDIQVIVPMRKNTIGVENLNGILQETFKQPGKKELRHGKHLFREGDKVIQQENNYSKDVYNGDIGVIREIKPVFDEDQELIEQKALYVSFNGKQIIYKKKEIDQLFPAYATTIHKCQGSEIPCIILIITTEHDIMLTRNLLYTGVTRARKLLCLIGCDRILQKAISNNNVNHRNTALAQRIVSLRKGGVGNGEEMPNVP
jgi:exodeoxyribonuclease V alpha subunit